MLKRNQDKNQRQLYYTAINITLHTTGVPNMLSTKGPILDLQQFGLLLFNGIFSTNYIVPYRSTMYIT